MQKKNNKYPILAEPPYAHAITKWNSDDRILSYEYNGRPTLVISIPGAGQVDFRTSSDGDLVSSPLVQQHYILVSEPVTATVTFNLSGDAINLRPKRAGDEQAVLGQVGRPLIYGANGLYDINEDLLLDWYGARWEWLESRLVNKGPDCLTATMSVELGPSPWIINFKMYYYKKHLGYEYHSPWKQRPKVEPLSGWCSWEAYRREISEEKLEEAADFVCRNFKDYGMKYIQLDDGFQPSQIPSSLDRSVADDWLSCNDKFPSGHKGNVENVKKYGLEAGIWIYTYVHNEEYAEKNPGFIKDADGKPVEGDWIGYIVDCLPETLRRYVTPSFKGFKDLGYTYVKTDGLRHLLYDGLHEAVRRGLITNDEAETRFRRYVEYIRDALGQDVFYLSSWGVMTQMVGIADACRISTDVNPSWAHMRMQMFETARWFHTQRILFINDPDHLCLRSKYEWAKSAISLCSLSGGLFMLSDTPEEYDSQRISMIKKNLPPLKTYAAETGLLDADYQAYTWTKAHGASFVASRDAGIDMNVKEEALITAAGRYPTIDNMHPFSTLWAFHMETCAGQWCVAARIATSPLGQSELKFENLGLDPKKTYIAFDFWAQEYLGNFEGALPCRELPLGYCQVIALRPDSGNPEFIASSRHVSMDAVSILDQKWDGRLLRMEIAGVPGSVENYYFYVPECFAPIDCLINKHHVDLCHKESILTVNIGFGVEKIILEIEFDLKA